MFASRQISKTAQLKAQVISEWVGSSPHSQQLAAKISKWWNLGTKLSMLCHAGKPHSHRNVFSHLPSSSATPYFLFLLSVSKLLTAIRDTSIAHVRQLAVTLLTGGSEPGSDFLCVSCSHTTYFPRSTPSHSDASAYSTDPQMCGLRFLQYIRRAMWPFYG